MKAKEEIDLFKFIEEQVEFAVKKYSLREPQAFARWFLEMYYLKPHGVFISDGSKDGKVDAFFKADDGRAVRHHVLNCKHTDEFRRPAPVSFYDEIISFKQMFDDEARRDAWLANGVKQELAPHYRELFERYQAGQAELAFVTNCRRNPRQVERVRDLERLRVFHLEELLQHVLDDYEVAMPVTPPLTLHSISQMLNAEPNEAGVPTSIVFARLIDFIEYLRGDRYNLLLARNVRVYQGPTPTNKDIKRTFQKEPEEFVFSNNGITVLCDEARHHANRQLQLENPRVVNGGQTLISIRNLPKPSETARVMVRIITLPRPKLDVPREHQKRKDVINKIAERSNMQNPIDKFDLRSFDDFHLDLYRHFRRQDMFYERRPGEWGQRSRELKSVGIKRGPRIRELTRYIACYYYQRPKLGPVAAKKPEELLNDDAYEPITRTSPELAHQIFRVGEFVIDCRKRLAGKTKRVSAYKGAMDMALISVVIKALQTSDLPWGKPELTELLEEQNRQWSERKAPWDRLVGASVKLIARRYETERARLWRRSREVLEPGRFFKNQSFVSPILNEAPGREARKSARRIFGG
jgi:hypothetical protein